MINIVLIAHNLRSAHNVGSLLRTADGLGVQKVFLTGYTPYPLVASSDDRLPHLAAKTNQQIAKTALGAETTVDWEYLADIKGLLKDLKRQGLTIAALEQSPESLALPSYKPPKTIALLVGREVEGIELDILADCDIVLEIPMFGQKESFNVVQAAAMALYHFRFAR